MFVLISGNVSDDKNQSIVAMPNVTELRYPTNKKVDYTPIFGDQFNITIFGVLLLMFGVVIGIIIYLIRKRSRDEKTIGQLIPKIDEVRQQGIIMTNRLIKLRDQNVSLRPKSMPTISSLLFVSRRNSHKQGRKSDIKTMVNALENDKRREIRRAAFTIGDKIGTGQFGDVYLGKLNGSNDGNDKLTVAIKSICTRLNEKEFGDALEEIEIMGAVNPHLNLVSMIGSCKSEAKGKNGRLWLILEFCPYGDLKDYLTNNKQKVLLGRTSEPINSRCLVKWANDVAKGMEYLFDNNIMHGDIAARNILLDKDPFGTEYRVAKVADFGLSKKMYDNTRYEKRSRMYVPWKWMALEYLTDGYFTLSSDVWSFGVLFWEILAFGKEPYGKQGYNEVLQQLKNGYRLSCPETVDNILSWSPQDLYRKISLACFVANPKHRATFSSVVEIISKELFPHEKEHYDGMISSYQKITASHYFKINTEGKDTVSLGRTREAINSRSLDMSTKDE